MRRYLYAENANRVVAGMIHIKGHENASIVKLIASLH